MRGAREAAQCPSRRSIEEFDLDHARAADLAVLIGPELLEGSKQWRTSELGEAREGRTWPLAEQSHDHRHVSHRAIGHGASVAAEAHGS